MRDRLTAFYQLITLITSLICLALLLWVLIREKFFPEWQQYQAGYQQMLEKRDSDYQGWEREIRQIVLDDLNTIDRCTSCHMGIEDPRMADAPSPYRNHSGDLLRIHPTEKFGCTVCHQGEGRVLTIQTVCTDWKDENSRYSSGYIQSSCGRCHLAIFEENMPLTGTERLLEGLQIFRREGCLGCHKVRGVGGTIGPDLSDQGNKIKAGYNFSHIRGKLTIPNWLMEHFTDPEKVSPGSQMLKFNLPDSDLKSLVTFTLGLFRPTLPLHYYSFASLKEYKSRREILAGEETFSLFCAGCHGKRGEGKNYQKNKTGVPTLNNRDFLSVASTDFLEFTINKGRSRRQMSAWTPELSGLYPEEISRAAMFIRSWKTSGPSWPEVSKFKGDITRGDTLYFRYCQMCHGEKGVDGLTVNLNNPEFLSLASDLFIYQTIRDGRMNTAMPSWGRLSARDLADLIRYLRSWQKTPSVQLSSDRISGDVKVGETQFNHLCIRCHGKDGSGGIGPAILNRDFLTVATDHYLLETISRGRSHTAMFGWNRNLGRLEQLPSQSMYDLVAFMSASRDSIPRIIQPGQSTGKPENGRRLYGKYCTECHGSEGEGTKAPALNNQEFLNAASNGYLLATISLGRESTDMPSWGRGSEKYPRLSIEQRQDITAYIRSWQQVIIHKN